MGKSWFKKESSPKTLGRTDRAAERADVRSQALKRYLRTQWCRHVKMPFYQQVTRVWPDSKIGRKYLSRQQRDAPHARVAAMVGKPAQAYDLILFSVIDWHFRFQRPQQLCRQFARMGYRVFYVETTLNSLSGLNGFERGYRFIDLPEPNIFVCELHCGLPRPDVYRSPMSEEYRREFTRGIEALREEHQIRSLVGVVENPFWRPLVEGIPGCLVVYDCLDHHAGFSTGTRAMEHEEGLLLNVADLVLTSSASLAERIGKVTDNVLVRNAVDFTFFSQKPATNKRPSSRPVVGYYGAIADWFNMALVVSAAQAFPEWDFWLIGTASGEQVAAARGIPNILFTGEVPYSELPSYLYGMDVCMIPFQENELTRCTNPVKVYEFLAAGKPVVTTWMPELELLREHVHVARSTEEFLAGLRAAMNQPGTPADIRRRTEWAAAQDWHVRARQIDEEIHKRFPLVSIIILTHNNLALTKACLASLLEFTDYPNYELVLVDNASTDGSVAFFADFAKQHQHVRLVLNPSNLGFAAGNNAGIKTARGDFIVLLNNDTYCTRGWLRDLLRHLMKNKRLGAVGPVTNNIGNEARVALAYANMTEMAAVARDYTSAHARVLLEVKSVAFFCVAMPRSVIDEVGLLDESFGLGFFEDDDYCNRIRQAGSRVGIADDVFIHHELSASFNALASTRRSELFQVNLKRYEEKWGQWTPHQYRKESVE
jgi:GT2 family glycosyltransferase/glycosyltransferase involved in cell wall biosynthesis